MSNLEYSTAEAMAGRAFYRAIASPARANYCSYIQLYNPPNSGVNVCVDALYVWAGLTLSGEYGIIHYATPFDTPALNGVVLDVFSAPLLPTRIGQPAPKCRLLAGTYPGNILPQIDYFFQSPTTIQPDAPFKLPYPIIFGPSDGIVLWNSTAGLEGKAGIWLREKLV